MNIYLKREKLTSVPGASVKENQYRNFVLENCEE